MNMKLRLVLVLGVWSVLWAGQAFADEVGHGWCLAAVQWSLDRLHASAFTRVTQPDSRSASVAKALVRC
jgi:hypothetical protein